MDTPLTLAAEEGHTEIATMLIAKAPPVLNDMSSMNE